MIARRDRTRLARAVRLYCSSHDIPEGALAEAWGVGKNTVCRLMAGQTFPHGALLMRILTWLMEPEDVVNAQANERKEG